MWLECEGSSFHSETKFRLEGKTVTVDKTGETRLKCGEKSTLLCGTRTKPLTGTAVAKTELNFSSNNSRSNGINYAHKLLGAQLVTLNRKQNQLCGYIPIKPARLTGIPGSKRHRVKRHLKLGSPAHAISSKRLMTLNDSLDSIGWAKSCHVRERLSHAGSETWEELNWFILDLPKDFTGVYDFEIKFSI